MAVTLIVNPNNGSTQTVQVAFQAGENIQWLLETAFNQQYPAPNVRMAYALQYSGAVGQPNSYGFNGYGYWVTMLNGFLENDAQRLYWQLLINGVGAAVGIDEYILQDGDVIEFDYAVYQESLHGKGYNAIKASAMQL
jgi:hypothetical protein